MGTITYETIGPQGSNQYWTAIYYLKGAEIGRATAPNKDAALNDAANIAYEHVKSLREGSQQGG